MVGHEITAEIMHSDGYAVDVRAWLTATPGLIVYLSLGDPGWIVTHQRSGLFIAGFHDPETAQAFAAALGEFDWTQPAREITANPDVSPTVAHLKCTFGAQYHKVNLGPQRDERMMA